MDTVDYAQFTMAFLLVIGLIGLMALAMRRFGDPAKRFGGKNAETRLRVVETRLLDSKRRLVLIERDHRQHLLLLGEQRETLIESFEKPATAPQQDFPVLE